MGLRLCTFCCLLLYALYPKLHALSNPQSEIVKVHSAYCIVLSKRATG
jgi:hypothetical protein